jgi:lysine-ketoglutarate reductase/saccharopine dehydrogenase-like protein (TIGR00300 family)
LASKTGGWDHAAEVLAEGHLIDSGTMSRILDQIVLHGGRFEILDFRMGRTNQEVSSARLKIRTQNEGSLEIILERLHDLGCRRGRLESVRLVPAPLDGAAPEDFYSTTNHPTFVRDSGKEIPVERQRMDSVLVVAGGRARCVKLRDVRRGDPVVCGIEGVRVERPARDRDRSDFGFMQNDVSSERLVHLAVNKLGRDILELRRRAEEKGEARAAVAVVAGPVVVHTGAAESLAWLLKEGYVRSLLAGNALAVHDLERHLFGTSLGISEETGRPVEEGHRNHMRAINAARLNGGIKGLVDKGILTGGIFHACVTSGVPFVLAGSIRDDGPLPEVITEMNRAQEAYAEALEGIDLVLILATMLHGIGVGNMIPSTVTTVCVDIHSPVVTKLSDRGSSQTLGVVTDVGLFLRLLREEIRGGAAGSVQ